jgi:hypothetical protein
MLLPLAALSSCSSPKMGLDKPFNADLLASDYASNIEKGNKNYKGEYLTVIGEVLQSYSNKYNENIIILMNKDKKFGVKCILSSSAKPMGRPLKQGEIVKVNGKCTGFEDNVVLKGCIMLKN